MNKKCNLAVVGVGQRGFAFVNMAMGHPQVNLVAVCDESEERLHAFSDQLKISAARFTDVHTMLEQVPEIDGVVITVPDFQHADIAVACFQHKKAVLLEKPMAQNMEECRRIVRARNESGGLLQMGLILRHSPVIKKMKEILNSGRLGQILTINAAEEIGMMHGASYMRRWHRKKCNSGSFILAKCSHDLDCLAYLIGENPCKVASFGDLSFFKAEKMRCTHCSKCDDKQCRFRFGGEMVRMTEAEKSRPSAGNFDLCVYNNDKDIVDHQVVLLEYPNGVKATFTLALFAPRATRTFRIVGTEGYLSADLEKQEILLTSSVGLPDEKIICERENDSGHGGSDKTLFDEFVECIFSGKQPTSDFRVGLASNVVGEAIECARMNGCVEHLNPEHYLFT